MHGAPKVAQRSGGLAPGAPLHFPLVLRKATSACLLTLLLAASGTAFAQGAGDDQDQDPFGNQPTQSQGGDDGGLSQEPPGGGGDSGSGDGGSGSGSGSGGDSGDDGGSAGEAGGAGDAEGSSGSGAEADELPNTGSEVFALAGLGVVLLLAGTGLRLRTIDPDAF